ncbi:MAG: hypothetical protein V3575_04185 [Candidatus Absconditabacteria bacterium]
MSNLEKKVTINEGGAEDRLSSYRSSFDQQQNIVGGKKQEIGAGEVDKVEIQIMHDRSDAMKEGKKQLGEGGDLLVGLNTCNNIQDLKMMLKGINVDKSKMDSIMAS